MNIAEDTSIKDLQRLKKKIEKQINAKKNKKVKKENFYNHIKDDHKKHLRGDGRKLFRSVVDYLECYINGLPPIAKSEFYTRFGVESKRKKITPEVVSEVKGLLNSGKTLKEASEVVGVSIASCQKIKKGDYDS
jgi:hypothetical protein|tara:strand:+ start:5687 stop:6088 length:402 start_codon:yes stop_codon:yes gene_type:complete